MSLERLVRLFAGSWPNLFSFLCPVLLVNGYVVNKHVSEYSTLVAGLSMVGWLTAWMMLGFWFRMFITKLVKGEY